MFSIIFVGWLFDKLVKKIEILLKLKKVIAVFFEGNIGSQKVMEKCGMRLNGKSDKEEYHGKVLMCYECGMEL